MADRDILSIGGLVVRIGAFVRHFARASVKKPRRDEISLCGAQSTPAKLHWEAKVVRKTTA
jgi:hypothetical protein